MGKYLLSLLLLCTFGVKAQQITITQEDMPKANDTLRVSLAMPTMSIDYKTSGANNTWDFGFLSPASQTVERFISPSSTPWTDPNKSNLASPVVIPDYLRDMGGTIGSVDIRNPFLFYQNTATAYEEVGFAATIMGFGFPIAYEVVYERNDQIYQFPLTFGKENASEAFFEVDFPFLSVYYAQTRKRINMVDGWGTLTTPYGTHEVLRVVSELHITDTLRTQEIPGTKTEWALAREYKWLGKNQGLPLLQINTSEIDEQEVVVSISYRDHYRSPALLASPDPLPQPAFSVYPSPLLPANELHLNVPPSLRDPVQVTLFDLKGQQIYQTTFSPPSPAGEALVIPAAAIGMGRGLYLMQIRSGNTIVVKKIVRN